MKTHCAIGLIVLLLTSCSNPDGDFKKAEQANTEQAYNEFIQKHPESPLVANAKSRIEQNSYEIARKTATVAAYEAYQKRFQTGELSQQAKRELEAIEFSEAGKLATITAWEGFLKKYPQSTNALQARQTLSRLEYESALKANEIASYESFLSRHPESEFVADVKKRLDSQFEERDWNAALLQNTEQGYLSFHKARSNSLNVKIVEGAFRAFMVTGNEGQMQATLFSLGSDKWRHTTSVEDGVRLGFLKTGADPSIVSDQTASLLGINRGNTVYSEDKPFNATVILVRTKIAKEGENEYRIFSIRREK